jgi:hypothetical protein
VTRYLDKRRGAGSPGVSYAVGRIAQYVVVLAGTLVCLDTLGVDLGTLAALGAMLSVGVGFGLQNVTQSAHPDGRPHRLAESGRRRERDALRSVRTEAPGTWHHYALITLLHPIAASRSSNGERLDVMAPDPLAAESRSYPHASV